MALLKTEPSRPVRSLGELFAIAHGMERDAAAHYAALAARLHGTGNPEAAAAFERLADEKRGRAAEVERWSKERTGTAPDPLAAHWKPQGIFGEEETGDDTSFRLMDAYRALSLAVRYQERAFAFWSYVLAQAGDPAVRQAAADLARDELHRASALRQERRRAFHTGNRVLRETGARRKRAGDPPRGWPGGAASLERELAARLRELAAAAARRGDEGGARTLREVAEESEALAVEAATAPTLALRVGQDLSSTVDAPDDGGAPLRAALRLAELAIERYVAAASAAKDEPAMLRAQSLAERAITRSARLGGVSG